MIATILARYQVIWRAGSIRRLEVDMLKPISAIAMSTGLLLLVGCTQTTVVKDNSVAAMFARSLPAGKVAQGNQVVKASANVVAMPSFQNATTAVNTAKSAAQTALPNQTTVGTIANALSPANIENAVHTALYQALTQHPGPQQAGQLQILQRQKFNNSSGMPIFYGPPPFIVGTFNVPIMYGPGPAYFNFPNH